MDSSYGDFLEKTGMTEEQFNAFVPRLLALRKDDQEYMSSSRMSMLNLDEVGVSNLDYASFHGNRGDVVMPTETEPDNHLEISIARCVMAGNGATEYVTEDRLPSIVSTQLASHGENLSSTRHTTAVKKRKRLETQNNVVLDDGILMQKRISRWSEDEHERFLQGVSKYGKGNWKVIAEEVVRTRTSIQVASHAQKYYLRQAQTNKMRSSINDDAVVKDAVKNSCTRSKQLPDMPGLSSSSTMEQRRSGCSSANNINHLRHGTVRDTSGLMQAPSPVPIQRNVNVMPDASFILGPSAYNNPSPQMAGQPSSFPVQRNFNEIALRCIPAHQWDPADVLERGRNSEWPIQPQLVDHQGYHYWPVMMQQAAAPAQLPAQWEPAGEGNLQQIRSLCMEPAYDSPVWFGESAEEGLPFYE